jgi:hypothetical protein
MAKRTTKTDRQRVNLKIEPNSKLRVPVATAKRLLDEGKPLREQAERQGIEIRRLAPPQK